MPLQVIITAAKTVSRASDLVSGPPDTINVTINATSMTVTATARTSDPNGSPTRWATISAWVTADKTAAPRTTATTTTTTVPGFRPQVSASTSRAINGESTAQESRGARAVAVVMVAPLCRQGAGEKPQHPSNHDLSRVSPAVLVALAVELQVFHRPTQPAQRSDDLAGLAQGHIAIEFTVDDQKRNVDVGGGVQWRDGFEQRFVALRVAVLADGSGGDPGLSISEEGLQVRHPADIHTSGEDAR